MHVSLEMGDSTVQKSPSSSSSSTSPTLSPSPPPPHFQAQNMPTFGPISSTELAHEMVSNFVNILIVDVQDDITGPKIVGAVRRRWIRSLVERLSVQDLNRLAAKHGFLPDIISHTSGNHRNGAILFDSTAEAAENSQAVDHAWLNWTGIKSSVGGDQIDYELDLDEEDFDEDDLELSFDSDECNSSCSCGADVDSATDGENKQAPMSYAAAVKGTTNFSSDNADAPTTSTTTAGEDSTLIFSSTPAVPDSSSNSVAAPTNSDNHPQTHHRHHHHQLNHSSQAFFRSRTTQLRTSLLMKLQADERVLHSDLVIFYDDHGEDEGYAARLARILSLDGLFNARYLKGGIEEFKKMAGWLCEGMPFPSVSQVVSSMDEDAMDTREGNESATVDSMGEIEKLREFQSSLVQSVWYSFRAPQKDVPRCVLDPFLWLGGQDAAHPENVKAFGITHVIRIGFFDSNFDVEGVEYHSYELEDSTSATIETIFEETANIIHTVRQTPGGKVLVHCHAGVSRSATIILVYLMRYCNLRLAQAFDLTFRARPIVRPNEGFGRKLQDVEKSIWGGESTIKLCWMCFDYGVYREFLEFLMRCEGVGVTTWGGCRVEIGGYYGDVSEFGFIQDMGVEDFEKGFASASVAENEMNDNDESGNQAAQEISESEDIQTESDETTVIPTQSNQPPPLPPRPEQTVTSTNHPTISVSAEPSPFTVDFDSSLSTATTTAKTTAASSPTRNLLLAAAIQQTPTPPITPSPSTTVTSPSSLKKRQRVDEKLNQLQTEIEGLQSSTSPAIKIHPEHVENEVENVVKDMAVGRSTNDTSRHHEMEIDG